MTIDGGTAAHGYPAMMADDLRGRCPVLNDVDGKLLTDDGWSRLSNLYYGCIMATTIYRGDDEVKTRSRTVAEM